VVHGHRPIIAPGAAGTWRTGRVDGPEL